MHPRSYWSANDFIEFFIYEMTHTLLFLDERRFQHYRDYPALANSRNFALSAILRRPRPLDKTVHSLLVAVEVLSYCEQVSGHPSHPMLHPRSPLIFDSYWQTLHSLRKMGNLQELVTPRVIHLLESCEESLVRIEKTLSEKRSSHLLC